MTAMPKGFGLACLGLLACLITLRTTTTLTKGASPFRWNDQREEDNPDHLAGTFNGFGVEYVDHPPKSLIHCVGDNFLETNDWMYRSCHYRNLCYDLVTMDFVVFIDPVIKLRYDWWSSTQEHPLRTGVIGGAQPRSWLPVTMDHKDLSFRVGEFCPRFEFDPENTPSSYYRMKDVTWVPFFRHPRSFRNPGHLIWDDFMSVFTLMDIFDRQDTPLLLSQLERPKSEEFDEGELPRNDLIHKFLPLITPRGHPGYNPKIYQTYELNLNHEGRAMMVCADHGLAGSGMFSDHGDHWHGQIPQDYQNPHNHGRGGVFRRFRSFVMKNIGFSPDLKVPSPHKIVFFPSSTTRGSRQATFEPQVEALEMALNHTNATIEVHGFANMTLREQIEVVSTTSVFVSATGGAASIATFLPKDATLILYFPWEGRNLDFDFWNNFPNLRVHWCPLYSMEKKKDINLFVDLVQKELQFMDEMTQFS